MGDREFGGDEWLTYPVENNISFSILLSKDMYIETEDGRLIQFSSLLPKKRNGRWKGWLNSMARTPENLLRFEGNNIKNESVVVATNIPAPKDALRLYRKRRGIVCLFADAKTRRINIEDTHMTDHNKLTILRTMVTLCMVWAYRCASQKMGRRGIAKKTHNRRKKSWSRIGLDTLRRWIRFDPKEALRA